MFFYDAETSLIRLKLLRIRETIDRFLHRKRSLTTLRMGLADRGIALYFHKKYGWIVPFSQAKNQLKDQIILWLVKAYLSKFTKGNIESGKPYCVSKNNVTDHSFWVNVICPLVKTATYKVIVSYLSSRANKSYCFPPSEKGIKVFVIKRKNSKRIEKNKRICCGASFHLIRIVPEMKICFYLRPVFRVFDMGAPSPKPLSTQKYQRAVQSFIANNSYSFDEFLHIPLQYLNTISFTLSNKNITLKKSEKSIDELEDVL